MVRSTVKTIRKREKPVSDSRKRLLGAVALIGLITAGCAGDAELDLGERNSSLFDPPAAGPCEHGERRTPVGRVRFAGDEAVGFEPVDGVGDRRRMDLESVADLAQRQLALLREGEEGEDLETREVEAERRQCGVDPARQDLVCSSDGGGGGHRVDGRPTGA